MRHFLIVLILCLSTVSAHAAELVWDAQTITSPLTVERSATNTGTDTWATVATLPNGATRFILTPGAYGWYRVSNSAGPSNVVQFSLDLYTGPVTTRLDALEARVAALSVAPPPIPTPIPSPPPAPTSNLTVRQIDADHIEVTCAGIGISTTGTGLQRVLTCKH